MSNRADKRKDYRHFPASYGDLFNEFADRGSATIGPMSEREARAALRDLYRFRMFLEHAINSDPSDAFARELHGRAKLAVLRVSPCAVTDLRSDYYMVELSLNPIERAMRTRPAPVAEPR